MKRFTGTMEKFTDWLEKLIKQYREAVRTAYKELSGEDLGDFMEDDNDDKID